MLSWVPYLAVGDLGYGGRLHGLLAGSIFAGSTFVQGLCVVDCGFRVAGRCKGEVCYAELYYVEPQTLSIIGSRLESLGVRAETVVVEHGGLSLHCNIHIAAEGCRRVEEEGLWLRILLLLPPLQPPPVQPLAVYSVEVEGFGICSGGRSFCLNNTAHMEAAVVDVVATRSRLEEWAQSFGARLMPVPVRLLPQRLPALAYAPVADENRGDLTPPP